MFRLCPFLPTMCGPRLACYTAISETRAAGNLLVQCLSYHCESVFRWDELSESAVYTASMRVTSGLYAYGYVHLLPTKMAPWQQLLHAQDVRWCQWKLSTWTSANLRFGKNSFCVLFAHPWNGCLGNWKSPKESKLQLLLETQKVEKNENLLSYTHALGSVLP